MPQGKRKRKLLLASGIILIAVVVLWFGLPIWFPWVLRPVARLEGGSYRAYQRLGYRQFALTGVVVTNNNVAVRVERLEAPSPNLFLWRHFTGGSKADFVDATGWQVEVGSSTNKGGPSEPLSVYGQVEEIAEILKNVLKWLPAAASFTNGSVRVEQAEVSLPLVTLSNGNLWAEAALSIKKGPKGEVFLGTYLSNLTVSAHFKDGLPTNIALESKALSVQSTVQVSEVSSALLLNGISVWTSNRIDWSAQFGRTGVLPEKASIQAQNFDFPAAVAGIPGYGNITGTANGNWEQGRFHLEVNAASRPLANETNYPPVQVELQAQGDTNNISIGKAICSLPWLTARFSPAVLHFSGRLLREPVGAEVEIDLSQQPWMEAHGFLKGKAELSPTTGRFPAADFQLAGADVGITNLSARAFSIAGRLDWPWFNDVSAQAGFEDGSEASVSGDINLKEKIIRDGRAQFTGPMGCRWLPEGYGYKDLLVDATFFGPLTELVHAGHLEVYDFTSPGLKPLQLRSDWNGTQLNLENAKVTLSAGPSMLAFDGAEIFDKVGATLVLKHLVVERDSAPELELESPINETFATGKQWSAVLGSVHLCGKGGDIRAQAGIDWPDAGFFRASVRNLSSQFLDDFLKTPLEEFEITRMDAFAAWTNAPASFGIDLQVRTPHLPESLIGADDITNHVATQPVEKQRDLASGTNAPPTQDVLHTPLSLDLNLAGDKNGLVITNLVVYSPTSAVTRAQGFLPLTLNPATPTNLVQFDRNEPFRFSASSRADAFFWALLADFTGVALSQPHLILNLGGTWNSPQGDIQLDAEHLQLKRAPPTTPAMDELHVVVKMDEEKARLAEGEIRVQGQPVQLTGELPLGDSFWKGLQDKRLPNWEKLSARLVINKAELAALEPLFPNLLSPQGVLSVDASITAGGKLSGSLMIHEARTRPIATIGAIRDIDITMKFLDRSLVLERASATLGGALVVAEGQGDLRGTNWLKGEIPPFKFVLRGTNVPLSRQPSSIIRSDLNLSVEKTNDAPAMITGTARLRDSFYLSDLGDLVPGHVATPSRRPPYFSFTTPPFSTWRLAVHVTGDRALKVRSTLFSGEVSANLHLQGTLAEPQSLGDVKIDSGIVRFPFTSLDVQQGFVTLSSGNPYEPQLQVSATSKWFGYDIKMEVNGPAEAPVIQFTSTPPLSSEQLVLMITAGEMPKGELSLTPQQKAQTVALFVGRDMLEKLGFGDQTESRLTIRSGEQVSEQGTPTYTVEYKLSDRWSLVGEYDRFNAYNAGFKWRVYSK
jgi:translocation and assembly module TamB